ncbi:MAG: AAA family ATPase [Armatimonadota bacterium]|nr:AAA family ATPase [Armatimonadota bacterium]
MILRRLRARRFLGLPEEPFEFARGVTVVVGPNEAGKSSLRAAIHTALFGNPATTSAQERDRYRAWGAGDPPVLELDLEIDGRHYTLIKDFAQRRTLLRDDAGRTWEQHKSVQERLVAQLGLASDKVFDATAHVAQAELERIHITSIARELGRIVGGGGEDVATAIRRLEQHLRALERGVRAPAREPGELRRWEIRVDDLQDRVARLRDSAAAAARLQADLQELRRRLTAVAEDLARKRALLEINRQIVAWQQQLEGLRREEAMLEEQVRAIEDTLTRLAAVDGELEAATAGGLPAPDAVAAARKLSERAAILEMEAGMLRREIERAADDEPAREARLWRIALGAGAVLAAAGAAAAVAGLTRPLAAAAAAGVGAAALLLGSWKLARSARERQRAEIRRQERERRLLDLDRALRDARAELAARLQQVGCATVQEAEQRAQRYRDLVTTRAQLVQFLQELRAGRTDEEITARWATVRRDAFALQEQLRSPDVVSRRLTPLELTSLEQEVRRLEQAAAEMQDAERRLLVELERHAVESDALAAAEEELAEARDCLERLRHRHAVYTAALEGLMDARRQAQVPLREVMERQAGEYLRVLSGGRYDRLAVDQDTLTLSVWSPDAGGWVEAREPALSRGTVDLVYLAARLALVDVLAGGRRPPLLFDDPFITFDEERRALAARLLRTLAASYQVVLFTCTRHFDAVADRLLVLPPRSGAAAPAAEPAPAAVGPLWEQPLDG